MGNYSKYIDTFKKNSDPAVYCNASQRMLSQMDERSQCSKEKRVIYQRTALVVGPVLTAFVHWVLEKALDRNIKTLFFLARDGQILKEIAEVLIRAYQLPIQCHYLYVSRYSLRKALFCIDRKEALELLSRNSIRVTPEILLNRTGLSSTLQDKILEDLQCKEPSQRSRELSPDELKLFSEHLRENMLFLKSMEYMSEIEGDKVFQYFVQEQMTSSELIAIVDSGWTGSIQRTMRQILESHHVKCKIEGFYFGILNNTFPEDGTYHSFYFSASDPYRYVRFNNNLFECWCMANHGMTIGYEIAKDGNIIPVLKEHTSLWYTQFQQLCISQYAETYVAIQKNWNSESECALINLVQPLLTRFMLHPDKDEAMVYGKIPFCDDASESYSTFLVSKLSARDWVGNLTLVKIICKFCKLKRPFLESGWKEGSVTLLPFPQRYLMELDCRFSYHVKTTIRRWS